MNLAKKTFKAWDNHLLEDRCPSEFFETIGDKVIGEYPFILLKALKSTFQSPIHHPEGSVWNHTMMVIDQAAAVKGKSSCKRAFMWAALLHDIGKPKTTRVRRSGKITAYNHEILGAGMAREFLNLFFPDEAFIEKTAMLVRWHMQLLSVTKSLPFADLERMKAQVNVHDVALLGFCDRLGRAGADFETEQRNVRMFLEKCLGHAEIL